MKIAELNINIASCFLECINFKNDLIEQKCFLCNKNYQKKFDEDLKKQH